MIMQQTMIMPEMIMQQTMMMQEMIMDDDARDGHATVTRSARRCCEPRARRRCSEQAFQSRILVLSKVQRAMNSEIKRRVEAHRTLEWMTEQIANDMFS